MARGGRRPGAGRPKGALAKATIEQKGTLEELARTHTETALNALVSVAGDVAQGAARVSAASAILDRGYGKPRQAVEHSGSIETVDSSNLTDVARRLAFILSQATKSKKE